MCSIVCAFNSHKNLISMRPQLLEMSKKLRHRGPDWSGIYSKDSAILVHERLSIVDPISGKQPLYSKNFNKVLAVNGEIYNHLELRKQFQSSYNFKTQSDCEVILALNIKYGSSFHASRDPDAAMLAASIQLPDAALSFLSSTL